VGDNLGVRLGHCCGEAEGVYSPLQVALPPVLLQWKPLTQGRLIHLHHCLQVRHHNMPTTLHVPHKSQCKLTSNMQDRTPWRLQKPEDTVVDAKTMKWRDIKPAPLHAKENTLITAEQACQDGVSSTASITACQTIHTVTAEQASTTNRNTPG